jgi:hypothetical protein
MLSIFMPNVILHSVVMLRLFNSILSIIMRSIVMLSALMLSIFMASVVMLRVVAPFRSSIC